MDQDFGEALPAATPVSAFVPPVPRPRYDFEVPSDIAVSDLLAIQLAECARMTRSLSDQVTDARLDDLERHRTVQSLESVITAAGDLAECIDRVHGGFGWRDQPATRKKVRKG